ncbi:uncharacterized protein N7483_004544 [Penicillium malachiteum]|uniref:uncharacterized protein n=1 Tax=Penicillium malachiteum TaxID=1324776 RepID=UPI002547AE0A|nr:uncharacterized protein N7483_004544 [Penicillium malachiteum]KAJ5730036.1 hypothetical protein N7483_004544 [Penicillium malachiteum]
MVGTWAWEDLWKHDNWHDEVILPAYKAHDERARMRQESGRRVNVLEFGEMWSTKFITNSGSMWLIFAVLDESSPPEELENVDRSVSRRLDESSSPGELGDTDESGSSEEEPWYESDWDSDDDYEEVEQDRSPATSEVEGDR